MDYTIPTITITNSKMEYIPCCYTPIKPILVSTHFTNHTTGDDIHGPTGYIAANNAGAFYLNLVASMVTSATCHFDVISDTIKTGCVGGLGRMGDGIGGARTKNGWK